VEVELVSDEVFHIIHRFSFSDSMNSFVNSLQTLVTKTMEDTWMTIKAYEKAR